MRHKSALFSFVSHVAVRGFIAVTLLLPAFAADGAYAAAKGPAASRNKQLARAWNQWNRLTHDYYQAVPNWLKVIENGTLRRRTAARAIPILKRLVATEDRIALLEPSYAPYLRYFELRNIAQLAAYGDKAALARLRAAVADSNPRKAMLGRLAIAQYHWWTANGNPAREIQVLQSLEPLAKQHPTSNAVTLGIVRIGAFAASVNPKVSNYAVKLVRQLKTPIARNTLVGLKARLRMARLMGEPLALTTRTLAGDSFNLKKWRGKVVLITFWQQPFSQFQLAGIYKEFHPSGLEILGVPINQRFTRIGTIMMTHPEMSWTQTAIQKPMNPGHTVFGLPLGPQNSMQIILDRQGKVRMVETSPRINAAVMVPEIRKLLAKK